jgi:hypothetical protein
MSGREIDRLVDAALAELPQWIPPPGFDRRIALQAAAQFAVMPPLPWVPLLLQQLQRGVLFAGGAYAAAELLRWGVSPGMLAGHAAAMGWVCILALAPLILVHLRHALR